MMGGCGLPSVTLEGTRSDWKSILDRIDKIPEFGEEPKEWAGMLRVILLRFVRCFDKGEPPQPDREFWELMINRGGPRMSGMTHISGWLGAFCAWDNRGAFFKHRAEVARRAKQRPQSFVAEEEEEEDLIFDGVSFPNVDYQFPEGYAEVDVKVVDRAKGKTMDCAMLAGHMGIAIEGAQHDIVRIAPQWFMYVKGKERDGTRGFWRS
jgi:Domain of unknown function (DUF4419)